MLDIHYKYSQEQSAMLNRYVKEYFSIERYNTIMNKLKELKAFGSDNSYWYGDADVYVWIEEIEDIECLVINNVVSCSDRPVCVIQVRDMGEDVGDKYNRYAIKAICTVNKSENKDGNYNWGDRRDYDVVGLDVIKEKGFRYLYQDRRDVEWGFKSSFFNKGYEDLTRDNTLFILQEMDYLYNNINDLNK